MTRLLADSMLAIGASPAASLVVKATLTVGLALLFARLARRSRAAVRHALLAGAFATLLLLPFASVILPAMPVDVPLMPPAAPAAQASPVVVIGAPLPVDVAVHETVSPAVGIPPSLRLIAKLVWGTGALLFLLPVIAGLRQTRALRRRSRPWARGAAIAQQLARDAGIRRHVDVRLDESLPGPMTCGILLPVIAMPTDARSWDEEALRRALIHELEHVRRVDWAVHCIARTVCALYWFHPLVWIAWRQLALEAERACDDAVVRRAEATQYAEQLVGLAQRLSGSSRPILAMTGRHDLATRVRALLDSAQSRGTVGYRCIAAVAAATAALVVIIAPLRTVAHAQDQQAASQEPPPAFEVASVRRNVSGANEQSMRRQPGGSFTVQNMPLRRLIVFAYQLQPFQLQGGPDWVGSDRFDIVAKAAGDPPWSAPWEVDPLRLMLRTLLAERFKLVLGRETQEMPIYELTMARRDGRLGPQLRPASTDCAAEIAAQLAAARKGGAPPAPDPQVRCGVRVAPDRIAFGGSPLSVLASTLAPIVGRIVVDRTGLTGTWDFELSYTPDPVQNPLAPAGEPPRPADPNAPSIFTALQEQLGLKLEPSRGPVEVLVIERVEQPTLD